MTFGRLTTKWRIFRSDLLSENGTQKNCQIICCAAKLHNHVINADNLNFLKVADDDYETLEVQPLEEGPEGNIGYLPMPFFPFKKLNLVGMDDEHCDQRRNVIVELLSKKTL